MDSPSRTAGQIRVEGARELRKSLRAAGEDLSSLKDTHKAAADIALSGILPLVPVVTGRLYNSVRSAGTQTAGIVRAGSKRVPYANSIQWGRRWWPARLAPAPPSGRRKVKAFIKPRLFMTEGAKETEPAWVALYEAEIKRALEKVKGK